jgi:succinate dehydrogenase / fumarate reductase flavoprotein subunit
MDHPKRDDENFLKHTAAFMRDGEEVIEYEPVTLGRFEVKERVY